MIPVLWVPERSRGSWDQGIVEELTAGDEFNHSPDAALDDLGGAIVVLAGQHCLDAAPALCDVIGRLPWSLTIVTSDEEALFPVDLLPRDDRHVVWGQYHARPEFDRVIPIGAAPGTADVLHDYWAIHSPDVRSTAVSFAGQATHARRVELVDTIKDMACDVRRYGDIAWFATTGFREGLSQDRYLALLAETRVAPCPSGPHSLDSFRLYEALAAGVLPIVELSTPHGDESEFWDSMFGADCPIPRLDTWRGLPSLMRLYRGPDGYHNRIWETRRDEVQKWWQEWRANLTGEFHATVNRLRES